MILITLLLAVQDVKPPEGKATERMKITKLADMPTHSYPITKKPSELVLDRTAVLALAAAIEKDINADLTKYEIADKTLLKTLYRTLASFAWYRGDATAARANSEKVGSLEDKPAEKMMNGLVMLSMLEAEPGANFHKSLQAKLTARLNALPWATVQDNIKQRKAQSEILSRNLVLGSVEAQLDKAASQGALSQALASAVVGSAVALEKIIPAKDDLTVAYSAVVTAHKTEAKADIWAARDVQLGMKEKLTPVNVAIWDSGTDVTLFPGQLWTGADKSNGIAWTLHSDKTTGALQPLEGKKEDLDQAKSNLKGFEDLQANVDSDDASAVKKRLSELPREGVQPFLENLGQFGNYSHGTHVAGITARGNPAARLMVARITFDYHLQPELPTIEQAQKDAKATEQTVAFFTKNNVRAANMSWGGALLEVDRALEKNHAGGTPDERRALAKKIFGIGYDSLKTALSKAKDTLFVVAAGNSDNDVEFDQVLPSSFKLPNVIVVCAVDQAGDQTSFTSFGNIDVCADGFEVESVIPGGDKVKFSGTSMAAPQVTNLAAKLWALHPKLTVAQVKDFIVRGSDEKKVGDKSIRLVNAKAALALAAK